VSFKYDPFGRRIQKSGITGITNYLYDGAEIVETVDSSATVVAAYTDGANIDEPLAMLNGNATRYYQQDGLGSVTSLSDPLGSITETLRYDAYGSSSQISYSLSLYGFTGREWDRDIDLVFSRTRYLDPTIGRFISPDPIAFFGGENFFRYVGNNPINFVDPTGLAPNVTPFQWRYCNGAELASCRSSCAAKGQLFESCRVIQLFRIGPRGLSVGPEWIDGQMSCSCVDRNACPKAHPSEVRSNPHALEQLKDLAIIFGIGGALTVQPELLPLVPALAPKFAH
jgi:RHS repeat-associated protein